MTDKAPTTAPASQAPQTLKKSRFNRGALFDLFIILTTLIVIKQSVLLVSEIGGGPASTLSAMFVGTWLLRRRGMSWADLGFKRPDSWLKVFLWAVFVVFLIILTSAVAGPIADLFSERQPRTNRFGDIEGDVVAYVLYLGLIWTHTAFFEELLFRAFIINRLEAFFGDMRWATPIAVVLAAAFFGYRHYYYQGLHGAFVTGCIGLSLGIYYVKRGRHNLWPMFLAHGSVNTLGFTFRFLGIEDD